MQYKWHCTVGKESENGGGGAHHELAIKPGGCNVAKLVEHNLADRVDKSWSRGRRFAAAAAAAITRRFRF